MARPPTERKAMADALTRAAERFEAEAHDLDERRERRRKPRRDDDSPAISMTLRRVARQLRAWADVCLAANEGERSYGNSVESAGRNQ